jgi:hypothetical protein
MFLTEVLQIKHQILHRRNSTSPLSKASANFSEVSFSNNQGKHPKSHLTTSVQRLTDLFPETLASALRADTNLEWQLAALDALSIWILRATRSADPANLALKITSSQWDSLLTLVWIRWSSAPNSNAIQKVLKELFSKTLVLQRVLYPDWETREIDALKRVVTMTGVDLKIQCFLIEVLVRRAPEGARRVMEIHKGWVKEMLERMKDSSVGPAIGKCLVSVLMTRRTELIMEDPEVSLLYILTVERSFALA